MGKKREKKGDINFILSSFAQNLKERIRRSFSLVGIITSNNHHSSKFFVISSCLFAEYEKLSAS
jgi:hypothetical protein